MERNCVSEKRTLSPSSGRKCIKNVQRAKNITPSATTYRRVNLDGLHNRLYSTRYLLIFVKLQRMDTTTMRQFAHNAPDMSLLQWNNV
jgi:hypothetical protein